LIQQGKPSVPKRQQAANFHIDKKWVFRGSYKPQKTVWAALNLEGPKNLKTI
jgi:hypothetical protein